MKLYWFFALAAAKEHVYNWTLSWKDVNPDGLKQRPVVTINDEFPLPVLRVPKGDRLVVNVFNELNEPARNATLHFHGMFQHGSNDMDGPPQVNQCPQPPGTMFTYNFTVNQTGTYWYHAHVDDLYPDGYRQIFLVTDDEPYFQDEYKEELAFSISDWYHELYAQIRDEKFMSLYNPSGAEPVPASFLFNDQVDFSTEILPDTSYRLRIVNTATFASFYWFIENQNVTVVEIDGVYVEPYKTTVLHLAAGQRYSVLFSTNKKDTFYRIGQVVDKTVFDYLPEGLKLNHTAWLYTKENTKELKELTVSDIFDSVPKSKHVSRKSFSCKDIIALDDMKLIPHDRMPLLPEPDHEITVKVELTNLLDGKNYAFFNGKSYTPPKVPTLYTVLDAPDDETAQNATIYGSNTNTFVIGYNDIVQLVVNNYDGGIHPFHLHGHNFQVLVSGPELEDGDEEENYNPWDPENHHKFPKIPIRRDVLTVRPYSHFVIRWKANNPGVWFFHCHVEWHLTQGLALQFIEAPVQIRQNQKIGRNHLDICQAVKVPSRGNAAGNLHDFFDLSGENRQVPPLPNGFTWKGIFALVVSTAVAFTGLGTLVWFAVEDTYDERLTSPSSSDI